MWVAEPVKALVPLWKLVIKVCAINRVVGLDASPEMLSIAEKHPFEQLLCQDIESFPYHLDCTIDAIISVGVFDFIQEPRILIEYLASIARPGHYFGLTVPETKNMNLNSWDRSKLEEMVLSCGYEMLRCEKISGYVDSETDQTTFYWAVLLIHH